MIIFFSQRDPHWNPLSLALKNNAPAHVVHAAAACCWPIHHRCEFYEALFVEHSNCVYYTTDENMILVAQWLKRTGAISRLQLVSVELCPDGSRYGHAIEVDEEGDICDDVPLGFFTQRLKYLR